MRRDLVDCPAWRGEASGAAVRARHDVWVRGPRREIDRLPDRSDGEVHHAKAGGSVADCLSRLLKKSFAAAAEDGVVAVVEGQLDLD